MYLIKPRLFAWFYNSMQKQDARLGKKSGVHNSHKIGGEK
jgi:hypothetical protein